ncbi:MAG: CcmD family protein [Deltaproteobacteria bacterium]
MTGIDYLGAAYTAIWVGFFFYLVSLGRKASRLEEELEDLKK